MNSRHIEGPDTSLCLTSTLHLLRAQNASCRRRGVLLVEFLLVFPIVVIGTFAVFEFGLLVLAINAVQAATTEGARHKAIGRTNAEVLTVIDEFLGVHSISSTERAVRIEDPDDVGSPFNDPDPNTCTPAGTAPVSGEIRVTVCVPATNAVPDFLNTFGFTLSSRTIHTSALAEKE
jgi:Flp pilus assembly protein TadG